MQPTQTLLDLLVEFYSARHYAREQALKAKDQAELLPAAEAALEKASRFPFLP
jgi:hypothetical protein